MQQQPLLSQALYKIDRTWEENSQEGPFFDGEIPLRVSQEATSTFLGYPIASPIGIAAGPLLNSRWTGLASQLGFDLVTYKTIRSKAHPSLPLPNVVFIESEGPLQPTGDQSVFLREEEPTLPAQLGITNSFGMPSRGPGFLIYDIHRAKALLQPHQVLIVSVVGCDPDEFVRAANIAVQGGADIVEVNFSCPNVKGREGSLYLDHEAVGKIGQRVVDVCGAIPVAMKVGTFPSDDQLHRTLGSAARAGIRAVCGINSVVGKVVTQNGDPVLGKERLTSGICGAPIREAGLDFVGRARSIIDREGLGLSLMGVGGVTEASHFVDLFEAGADCALSATGAMWNPYLAHEYHQIIAGVHVP